MHRSTGVDQSVDLVQHCLLNPHFTVCPTEVGGPILEEVHVDVPLLLVIDRDRVERACTKSREMTQGACDIRLWRRTHGTEHRRDLPNRGEVGQRLWMAGKLARIT